MSDSEYDPAEAVTQIVCSFVANNNLAASELPSLIRTVRSSLDGLSGPPPVEAQEPAHPLRRLVTPDAVYCAECGKGFKSLKRHLGTDHDLTPQAYRKKWGLKADSPMVAPSYSATRSELARSIGLGRKAKPLPEPTKPVKASKAPVAKATPTPEPAPAPKAASKAKVRAHPKPAKATLDQGALNGGGRPSPAFEED